MKKLLSILAILTVFTVFGQAQGSPMPYGIRVLNTQEVDYGDFERIPVMYSNGQIADWINKADLLAGGTAGTVTSVDLSVPLGFQITGNPITTNGTFVLSFASGYTGYTTSEQTKLSGIATGAEVNVNADWLAVSGDAQILNKPTIPTPLANITDNATGVAITGNSSATGGYIARTTNASVATSYLFDFNNFSEHYNITLTDNASFGFSNMITSTQTATFTVTITNASSYAFTFPSWLKKSLNSDDPSTLDEIVINVKYGGGSPSGYYTLNNVN